MGKSGRKNKKYSAEFKASVIDKASKGKAGCPPKLNKPVEEDLIAENQ